MEGEKPEFIAEVSGIIAAWSGMVATNRGENLM